MDRYVSDQCCTAIYKRATLMPDTRKSANKYHMAVLKWQNLLPSYSFNVMIYLPLILDEEIDKYITTYNLKSIDPGRVPLSVTRNIPCGCIW